MTTTKKRLAIRSTLLAMVLTATAFAADAAPAKKTAEAAADPILRDLQTEMLRSKEHLKLENSPAPYFIDYRVVDVDSWGASASLGGIASETRQRIRFLLVQVRLGDYKQDNSSGRGEGMVELLPLDNDEHAFRFQVWSATDRAYKQAVESLTAKQARLKELTIDHPVDDFAKAEPVQSLQPVVELKVEREPWLKMLREASSLYIKDPKVESLDARLEFEAVNRYYLNSDGTAVRDGEQLYNLSIRGDTQAEDGMRLDRNANFTATTLKELPSAKEFSERANEVVASLKELREAPLADEDYQGPVLFSARASTMIFSSLIGDNALGQRPDLGQNARVRSAFASSYKMRVLPDFLAVSDDPTLAEWQGKTLVGHYAVDDEGVKAQAVPLVDKGVLVNYLLGRQPIRDFPVSNGHGRARLPLSWPEPALGNLIVKPTGAVTPEALKQRLITMCKDGGREYGYYVKAMAGLHAPRLLYRVYAKDGHEELVRGAQFGDLDRRSMRSSIVAAGTDFSVDNILEPMPHSVVAPSILFDDLELKRQTTGKDKLPEYPAPMVEKK